MKKIPKLPPTPGRGKEAAGQESPLLSVLVPFYGEKLD